MKNRGYMHLIFWTHHRGSETVIAYFDVWFSPVLLICLCKEPFKLFQSEGIAHV
jgi:hypothetical protein